MTRGTAEYATKSGGLGDLSENIENILSGRSSISYRIEAQRYRADYLDLRSAMEGYNMSSISSASSLVVIIGGLNRTRV